MATPTLTLINHTSINTAESTTNWTKWDTLDPEVKKEGSNGITGTFRSDLDTGYYDHGSAPVTAANKHVRMWLNFTAVAYLDTEANNGMEFLMYDGSTTEYRVAFGSDTYFGGWINYVVDCDKFTTLTLANVQRWGCRFNRTSAPANKDNFWADYIRYLDGYYVTGGTSGDKIDLAGIASEDIDTSGTLNGYGIVLEYEGAYFCYGELQIGNGATTTYFEMINEVLIYTDQPVASGLYKFEGDGSGCDIVLESSVIKSAGSTDDTRFILDMDETNLSSVSITDSKFTRAGECRFKSGQTVTDNAFVDCGQILAAGADFDGCSVDEYEGTANTSALIWNVNTDPDGLLDNMSFTKGTAATHAIEFGTTSPTTMTLRGVDVSGYNASNNQNDSTLHIKRTTGDVSISLIDCSGTFSYRTDGANVTISNTKNVSFHVEDKDENNIQGARVDVQKDPAITYTSAASGNNQGDTDFVVQEAIANENPDTGFFSVVDKSTGKYQSYRYSSVNTGTKTFTLQDGSWSNSYTCSANGSPAATQLLDTVNSPFISQGVEVGDTVRNTTDGSWARVEVVVSSSELTTSKLTGGTDNEWQSGDDYDFGQLAVTYNGNDKVSVSLMSDETDASGDASGTFKYQGAPQNIKFRVRKHSSGTLYEPLKGTGQIGANGFSITVALEEAVDN